MNDVRVGGWKGIVKVISVTDTIVENLMTDFGTYKYLTSALEEHIIILHVIKIAVIMIIIMLVAGAARRNYVMYSLDTLRVWLY